MDNSRTIALIKDDGIKRLHDTNMLIVGIGGVGAYSAECVCRAGIGRITLIDGDCVSSSNLNRQLPALTSTIGKPKVEVLRERFLDINPDLKIHVINKFIAEDDIDEILDRGKFDYIIDAIDMIKPKVALCKGANERKISIACSMGAGGRTDPSKVCVADISKTYNDGLAAAFRARLRKEGIYKGIKVVFSTELADESSIITESSGGRQTSVRGTISYLPAIFGTMLAGVAIQDVLLKQS